MSSDAETDPLLVNCTVNGSVQGKGQVQETRVYWRRFYILAAASLLSFCQGWIWNTWGPIQDAAEHVFNWSDSTIALLANWGPISYILVVLFFSWLLDVKGKTSFAVQYHWLPIILGYYAGLRWSVLITAALVVVGAGIRCISMEPETATW